MKALLITPEDQAIEEVEVSSHDDIVKLIGYDKVTSDEIGPGGDRLFFDKECLGRFQIDAVIPVSGKGVIIGSPDDGTTLKDAVSDVDGIMQRLKYL
jgi:hypothetical protein